MARVSDEVLASVCDILAKTEGILPLGDLSTFGDVLRGCALDLRDARAEIVKIKARVAEWKELADKRSARFCPSAKATEQNGEGQEDARHWKARAERAESDMASAKDVVNTWLRENGRDGAQVGSHGDIREAIDALVFAVQARNQRPV